MQDSNSVTSIVVPKMLRSVKWAFKSFLLSQSCTTTVYVLLGFGVRSDLVFRSGGIDHYMIVLSKEKQYTIWECDATSFSARVHRTFCSYIYFFFRALQRNISENNLPNPATSFLYATESDVGKNEFLIEGWDLVEHPTFPPPPSQGEDVEHWTRAMFIDATKKWLGHLGFFFLMTSKHLNVFLLM